ncbi:MAG: hypothetical protein IKE14_10510 [Loktanella sp.]|nr:hypothetical protein [Loktanella sp.]
MAQANTPFEKRLKQIMRKHDQLAKGSVKTVTSDGLIVMKPRVYRPKFPLRGVILVVGLGFAVKGLLLAIIGDAAYADRVAGLEQGGALHKTGAWVMQIDPATVLIADLVAPYLD